MNWNQNQTSRKQETEPVDHKTLDKAVGDLAHLSEEQIATIRRVHHSELGRDNWIGEVRYFKVGNARRNALLLAAQCKGKEPKFEIGYHGTRISNIPSILENGLQGCVRTNLSQAQHDRFVQPSEMVYCEGRHRPHRTTSSAGNSETQ